MDELINRQIHKQVDRQTLEVERPRWQQPGGRKDSCAWWFWRTVLCILTWREKSEQFEPWCKGSAERSPAVSWVWTGTSPERRAGWSQWCSPLIVLCSLSCLGADPNQTMMDVQRTGLLVQTHSCLLEFLNRQWQIDGFWMKGRCNFLLKGRSCTINDLLRVVNHVVHIYFCKAFM